MKFTFNKAVIFSSLLLSTSLVFTSCNEEEFLDVAPTGVLTKDVLASKAGIEGLLVGGYAQLNGRGNRLGGSTNWVHGSIRGGDANKGTDPGDFAIINVAQRFEIIPTDGVPSDKWNGNFAGVSRANQIVSVALASQDPSVDEDFRKNAVAQAKFLRAHFYFELVKCFKNVPYFDETVPFADILSVPNTIDIWPEIENDLTEAIADLPDRQGSVGMVNSWAARAMLGKVYLFQGKFSEARTTLDNVIANGQTSNGLPYDLMPEYSQVFNSAFDNGPESVFAMQAAANTGTTNNANPQFDLNFPHNTGPGGPGGCCGFFQPSFELVSSFRTDANGLPLLDGSYRDPANRVVDDMNLGPADPFTEDTGNLDPRLDHSVGRRGIPYLDWGDHPGSPWIRNQPNGGPFSPKKFVYYRAEEGTGSDGTSWTRGYGSMNYNIIRFADVLLMAAEAHIEDAAGSLETARAYVNRVRQRAINSPVYEADGTTPAANYVMSTYDAPWTDREAARQATRFERKLELSGEGHRFFDLVRWGIAKSEMDTYLAYENQFLTATGTLAGAVFTANQDEYYPIPQTQLDLHGGSLVQNQGY